MVTRRLAAVLVCGALATGGPTQAASDPLHGLAPPAAGDLRLFVVRHGEAFSNLPHPPTTDSAELGRLTDRGQTQVRDAARALAGHGITARPHLARRTRAPDH